MENKIHGGYIYYEKESQTIEVSYVKDEDAKFTTKTMVDMKSTPIKDDFELLTELNKVLEKGTTYVDDNLKGMNYGLNSLLKNKQFEFVIDYSKLKTHIVMPSINESREKWIKSFAVANESKPLLPFSTSLLDYNVMMRKNDIENIDDNTQSL